MKNCLHTAESFRRSIAAWTGVKFASPAQVWQLELLDPRRRGVKLPGSTQSWFAVATCLTVLLVATFAIVASRSQSVGDESAFASVPLPAGDRDATFLAALDLPVDCTTHLPTELAAASFDCCTKCHTAGSNVSSSRKAILKSSAACVACHDWLAKSVSQSLSFIFTPERIERDKPSPLAVATLLQPKQREADLAGTVSRVDAANNPSRQTVPEPAWLPQAPKSTDRQPIMSWTVQPFRGSSRDDSFRTV